MMLENLKLGLLSQPEPSPIMIIGLQLTEPGDGDCMNQPLPTKRLLIMIIAHLRRVIDDSTVGKLLPAKPTFSVIIREDDREIPME